MATAELGWFSARFLRTSCRSCSWTCTPPILSMRPKRKLTLLHDGVEDLLNRSLDDVTTRCYLRARVNVFVFTDSKILTPSVQAIHPQWRGQKGQSL